MCSNQDHTKTLLKWRIGRDEKESQIALLVHDIFTCFRDDFGDNRFGNGSGAN